METLEPTVSVIITCFNHGAYLSAAIGSINNQTYDNIEIVVVDDGSTDNTRDVLHSFSTVKYVYQHNQGLSVARNTGIDVSTGKFIVFLDADDWLLKDGIETNIKFILSNSKLAFVSGGHVKVLEERNIIEEKKIEVNGNHYQRLLRGNFIAMHGAVLYQRWVFDYFRFDSNLRALEDYDMYLKITRTYPIHHHTHLIAAYRIHNLNMSGNIPLMLNSALTVLRRQRSLLKNKLERSNYVAGLKYWKNYYCSIIYCDLGLLPWSDIKNKKQELSLLFKTNPFLYLKLLIKKFINAHQKPG